MQPSHLEILLSLARGGLASRAERLPAQQLSEAASAIIAGEGYLVALRSQSQKAPQSDKKDGGS